MIGQDSVRTNRFDDWHVDRVIPMRYGLFFTHVAAPIDLNEMAMHGNVLDQLIVTASHREVRRIGFACQRQLGFGLDQFVDLFHPLVHGAFAPGHRQMMQLDDEQVRLRVERRPDHMQLPLPTMFAVRRAPVGVVDQRPAIVVHARPPKAQRGPLRDAVGHRINLVARAKIRHGHLFALARAR